MATAVYLLCSLASVACAVLLWRGWKRSRSRLLLWSACCFVLLAANNAILFVDLSVWTDVDLAAWRTGTGLAGLVVLLSGLIWESR
ncbi:MAG TPA: DUF5985 family protein [Gaiellaceae bacterium]|nr:DUF5985 family protein [Gaiellaceae bacterium]